ncbi:uncharacterized protein PADG_05962 [Paracoccidioides brasiliensis Pb18]|uniref:N-acetyltransferase domain-containing protein n=2 Tax=Paracoccidioides brasiliensis TaxID=121759 RepID=C1GFC6_PARBD|nr:uncharacterized protein PADG_05962 [Paracoccidioides brasiliensis Pb18]EEH49883.2 hypothetical protein PADG_05962 [Paracoccidioides brasiliensis Pb18]ODH13887.1 hypothetical protein ACO22_06817 [Paracoccidioides brasiliensis]
MFTIRPVRTPEDLSTAVSLIKPYMPGLDLSYQDFESEMAAHDQKPPQSQAQPQPLGCIALRPLCLQGQLDALPASPSQPKLYSSGNDGDAGASGSYAKPKDCERKRLYVTPPARGWERRW